MQWRFRLVMELLHFAGNVCWRFHARGWMRDFKIVVSRVETVAPLGQMKEVCVTFKCEPDRVVFQVPICLRHKDFADTEINRAARNTPHTIFSDLAKQCKSWSLTSTELRELMMSNLRPSTPSAPTQ